MSQNIMIMEESGNENRLGVLTLLPIELWEEILERLDDSKDVKSFCKAWKFPDWDAILHRTKASWLFDEVFPLVFPYILEKKEVLNCRLVCRRWLKACKGGSVLTVQYCMFLYEE